MPLYLNLSDSRSKILIWKFDEEENLNIDELVEPENLEKVRAYHPKKIKEVVMIRCMLQQLLPGYKIVYKENGEPFLEPNDYHISISHSFPLAAIAISEKKIGIDLERKKEKIKSIRHKFIMHEEVYIEEPDEVEYLTCIWAAKEALYKLHHSKYWSLKKHYDIQSFNLSDHFVVNAKVYDANFTDFFSVEMRKLDDYYLAVVMD